MKLLIDVGNTRIKWRINGTSELFSSPVLSSDFSEWLIRNNAELDAVAISSVQSRQCNASLIELFEKFELEYWFAKSDSESLGLISAYSNPKNLGVDRWLAMLALWHRLKTGFMVVDAGTAITIDLVGNDGKHLGGFILPGLSMQRQALLGESLVLKGQVDEVLSPSLSLGVDTDEAIDNGILASTVALIQRLIAENDSWLAHMFFTGGDAQSLKALIPQAQIEEALVMDGLSLAWNREQSERSVSRAK